MSDLKRFSLDKGEGGVQLSLLRSPLLANEAVPDNHLFSTLVEARVEVKGQIRPIGGHVHCDPDTQRQEPLVGSQCSLTHTVIELNTGTKTSMFVRIFVHFTAARESQLVSYVLNW